MTDTPIETWPRERDRSGIAEWILALRPHYWVKNLAVFVPAIVAAPILDPDALWRCLAGFLAFCLAASSGYLVNDVLDRHRDSNCPERRSRPIASGSITVSQAIAGAVGLAGLAMLLLCIMAPQAIPLLFGYLTLSLTYSMRLKHVPFLDVALLSLLHTWRIIIGVSLAAVVLSPWLVSFAFSFFLSLAFSKRMSEIAVCRRAGQYQVQGRSYKTNDAVPVFVLGVGAGIATIAILAAYIDRAIFVPGLLSSPQVLWVTLALLAAWLTHIWRTARAGLLTADPVLFALGDRFSLMLAAAAATSLVVAVL